MPKQLIKYNLFIILVAILLLDNLNLNAYSFNKITILSNPYSKDGPGSVLSSLLDGLQQLNTPFNHNPQSTQSVGDVVVVLSDINKLRQAINWKKEKRIKRLIAGPNLILRSFDHNSIIVSPEIDMNIQPSEWPIIHLEQDDPRLNERIKVWYAGINSNTWQPPSEKIDSKKVLVYWKSSTQKLCEDVENLLKKYGWIPIRITYGQYNHVQYKQILSESTFAIFLSRSESQGMALAEAWAMNVPTLAWNPKELFAHGKQYNPVSSCPYLTPVTGHDWKELYELEELLKTIPEKLNDYSPRTWVLDNMTTTISAQVLLDIIKST